MYLSRFLLRLLWRLFKNLLKRPLKRCLQQITYPLNRVEREGIQHGATEELRVPPRQSEYVAGVENDLTSLLYLFLFLEG
jgi:hypothetical protein